MKRILGLYLTFTCVLIGTYDIYAQDLIITSLGDSVNCKVLDVGLDSVKMSVKVGRREVKTFQLTEKIRDIQIGFYERAFLKEPSDTVKYYLVETRDGNVYAGQVLKQEAGTIRLRTKSIGEITLRIEDIDRMEIVETEVADSDAGRWFDYLQSSRYFYGPTGYGLKKGDAYYQNVWLFFNQFVLGITDHFSAGVGVVPLFLFGGAPTPAWVTPKFSIPVVDDKFNLGVGALMGGIIGFDEFSSANSGFGILYGIATVGDRDRNFSFGLGYGYAGGDFTQTPSINFSGMLPVGRRGYLISENYIIDEIALFSLGGRSLIKRVTLDYGMIFPTDTGTFIGIPWLGIVIPIDTKPASRSSR